MSMDQIFFEDVASTVDYWAKQTADLLTVANADDTHVENKAALLAIRDALQNIPSSDVESVLRERFVGVVHSMLVILDGGTKMAETGRLHLVDGSGTSIGEGLHERFHDHLFETGRMKYHQE